MITIKVLSSQTVMDIALQYCGTVEAAWQIIQANDVSLTDVLQPGQRLLVPDVVDAKVADFYTQNNVAPATAMPVETTPENAIYANDGETLLVTNDNQYQIVKNN